MLRSGAGTALRADRLGPLTSTARFMEQVSLTPVTATRSVSPALTRQGTASHAGDRQSRNHDVVRHLPPKSHDITVVRSEGFEPPTF